MQESPISERINNLENLPGGVLVYRLNGTELLYANEKALEIFECDSRQELCLLTRNRFNSLIHPNDFDRVEHEIAAQINTGINHFSHIKHRIRTRTGKIRYIEDFGHFVKKDSLFYIFIVSADDRARTYKIDSLTNLPERKRFLEYSKQMLSLCKQNPDAEPMAFLFFNIRRFKLLNIKYGTDSGDLFLKSFAAELQKTFPNDYVSHFVADSFVVLTDFANSISKIKLLQPFGAAEYPELNLEIQAGIYKISSEEDDPAVACEFAKIACDSIQNQNDEHYCIYTASLSKSLALRQQAVNFLNEAIEKKFIKVFYQPVIRTLSGMLCQFEALARWEIPGQGIISPAEFIPALEESRQIHKLDSYIVWEICRNYREETDAGRPTVPVSFNLSRLDFSCCDIFQVVNNAAAEFNVPHEMILVEITESIFSQNSLPLSTEIERFHKAGYQVLMDDFGSEYSSLNVLKDLLFDEIKIDMKFLSTFTTISKTIITSVIDMAKKIGLRTLAEGVETEEHFEFLKNNGCEKIQGFFFGKPLPYKESVAHCLEKGIFFEADEWRPYYDELGKLNLITDVPFAIAEYDGKKYSNLFANSSYMQTLRDGGVKDLTESETIINETSCILSQKMHSFTQKALHSDKEESYIYVSDRGYLKISIRKIAEHCGKFAYTMYFSTIAGKTDIREELRLNTMLGNLSLLYDDIRIANLSEDYEEILLSNIENPRDLQQKIPGILKQIEKK